MRMRPWKGVFPLERECWLPGGLKASPSLAAYRIRSSSSFKRHMGEEASAFCYGFFH